MTVTFTKPEAELILNQMNGHGFALKNWIVSAVETGRTEDAVKMAKELRMTEDLARTFRKVLNAEI